MKSNTAEKRDHIEAPWNYEDETRKIYSGQDVAEIIRNAEHTAESATLMDIVREFLKLNANAEAALDLFAAAASFKYNVTPKE